MCIEPNANMTPPSVRRALEFGQLRRLSPLVVDIPTRFVAYFPRLMLQTLAARKGCRYGKR